ncbi:replication protein A2, putative [Eimeria maxima]|uniref:Replication protein A2, putative n=1 Tax=Eimeria maxima TaxID=5804 RepID=U6MEV2_EIMMA|nr:replication protein A2, putative [Eimeria maxima]CDJ61568.1 replication protein A2, putative [Eimeria maxima]
MQDPSSLQVSYFPSGPLLHLVKLIGVVDAPSRETLESALQSARIQFTLDDFTGRIECEYTVGDELTEYRQNQILVGHCTSDLALPFIPDLIYHESACQAAYLRLKYPNDEPDVVPSTGQQQPMNLPPPPQQQQQPFGVPQSGTMLNVGRAARAAQRC